jgi:hypothetical protein
VQNTERKRAHWVIQSDEEGAQAPWAKMTTGRRWDSSDPRGGGGAGGGARWSARRRLGAIDEENPAGGKDTRPAVDGGNSSRCFFKNSVLNGIRGGTAFGVLRCFSLFGFFLECLIVSRLNLNSSSVEFFGQLVIVHVSYGISNTTIGFSKLIWLLHVHPVIIEGTKITMRFTIMKENETNEQTLAGWTC